MPNLEQEAVAACKNEPVHIPGTIQPHGALLGLCLKDVLGSKHLHKLQNASQIDSFSQTSEPIGVMMVDSAKLNISAFRPGDSIVLEFKPSVPAPWTEIEVACEISRLLEQINRVSGVNELFENAAFWLSKVTDFDRVMVYKFHEDGSGEVIAEEVAPGVDSFLGLRFPSWDIPTQAKAIMARIPLRCFSDVGQTPVPLIAKDAALPP